MSAHPTAAATSIEEIASARRNAHEAWTSVLLAQAALIREGAPAGDLARLDALEQQALAVWMALRAEHARLDPAERERQAQEGARFAALVAKAVEEPR